MTENPKESAKNRMYKLLNEITGPEYNASKILDLFEDCISDAWDAGYDHGRSSYNDH